MQDQAFEAFEAFESFEAFEVFKTFEGVEAFQTFESFGAFETFKAFRALEVHGEVHHLACPWLCQSAGDQSSACDARLEMISGLGCRPNAC